MPVPRPTNGLAVASLVCSVGGIVIWPIWPLTAIAGIILGFVAKSMIDKEGRAQGGRGLALAGIIVGFCVVGIAIIVIALIIAAATSSSG